MMLANFLPAARSVLPLRNNHEVGFYARASCSGMKWGGGGGVQEQAGGGIRGGKQTESY